MSYAKGEKPQDADYAKGGAALGRVREFLKESDGADQTVVPFKLYKDPNEEEECYSKTDGKPDLAKRKGETKVLKTVKPRN